MRIVVLQLHVFETFESVTVQSVRIADLVIKCIIYHLNRSLESLLNLLSCKYMYLKHLNRSLYSL